MTEKLNLTRRATIAMIAGLAATTATPMFAQAAKADIAVEEMSVGADDAPITMIEYASFTCPHCRAFHEDVYPSIKANYIDTGKVRMIYRPVYFDRLGLWADLLARCGGKDRFFGVAGLIYENQSTWTQGAGAVDIVNNLYGLGRLAGMNDADMEACMQDNDTAQALVTDATANLESDDIGGTPTFIINGETMSNMPYSGFVEEFERILAS